MSDGWGEDVWGSAVDPSPRFPDMDAPSPFPDAASAKGFGRSSTSRFTGTHVNQVTGAVDYVAKVSGGGGFSAMEQPKS
jgi:hypothetical protein